MTIAYPLDLPFSKFLSVTIQPQSIVAESRSSFTGKRQVQVFPGQFWTASVGLPILERDEAEPVTAFIASLNGKEGTFLLGDPANAVPRGAAKDIASSPQVNGAAQTGQSVAIRNAPVALEAWLLAGDMIQIGTRTRARLHKVLTQVDTDAAGEAVIDIWPRLRESPPDGDSVVYLDAKGLFAQTTNEPSWSERPPYLYEISISAAEAF